MSEARDSLTPGARGRSRAMKRGDGALLRPVDLTGRERQLRAAMQAMAQVAARFSRGAKRTLPFLVRHRSRLVPQPVSIINPAEDAPVATDGPSFEVILEAEELPAWASLSMSGVALRLILEGSLGARTPGTGELGPELTLAQRALIGRVARSLAEDFAQSVKEEVGLSFAIVSSHGRSADEPIEPPGPDGLRVDCVFENIPGDALISIAVSAEALESAAREHDDEAPTAADPRMAEALREVPVELVAELGSVRMGIREVLALKVGQIVRLGTAVDDPVIVSLGGISKFAGRPVVSRGQLSVEIRGRLEE